MLRGLLAALVVLAAPVSALANPEQYNALGPGTMSCGNWSTFRHGNASDWIPQADWVLGYITAYNYFIWTRSTNVADGADSDVLMAWIDDYCTAHPLDSLAAATHALVVEFARRQISK